MDYDDVLDGWLVVVGRCGCRYVYDLGDWWSHTVTLEAVEPMARGAPPVEVLDGWGTVPGVDSGGPVCYLETITSLFTPAPGKPLERRKLNPDYAEWWALLNDEIRGQLNGALRWRCDNFQLESAQQRVTEALYRPTDPAKAKDAFNRKTCGSHDSQVSLPEPVAASSNELASEPGTKPGCAVCGSVLSNKACSVCRRVSYCCKEHQRQDWKRHKAECVPTSKSKSSRK